MIKKSLWLCPSGGHGLRLGSQFGDRASKPGSPASRRRLGHIARQWACNRGGCRQVRELHHAPLGWQCPSRGPRPLSAALLPAPRIGGHERALPLRIGQAALLERRMGGRPDRSRGWHLPAATSQSGWWRANMASATRPRIIGACMDNTILSVMQVVGDVSVSAARRSASAPNSVRAAPPTERVPFASGNRRIEIGRSACRHTPPMAPPLPRSMQPSLHKP